MMAQTLILDLDGTILEGRQRHYACYAGILRELGYQPLPLADYWQMKRQRLPLSEQLAASHATAVMTEFRGLWLERIEQPEFLALDSIAPDVRATLENWHAAGHKMLLATLRHNVEGLHKQLQKLDLTPFFTTILTAPHQLGSAGKAAMVRTALAQNPDSQPDAGPAPRWWIGDTEIDIMAARELGCRVCVITEGLRTAEYLAQFAPDCAVAKLSDVSVW